MFINSQGHPGANVQRFCTCPALLVTRDHSIQQDTRCFHHGFLCTTQRLREKEQALSTKTHVARGTGEAGRGLVRFKVDYHFAATDTAEFDFDFPTILKSGVRT